MKHLKKLLIILIPTLFISMTVSGQSTVLSNDLLRLYIVKAKQSYMDSISLLECEQQVILSEMKYEAMEAQSEHFYNQLVVATDKVNEGNKVNLRLQKAVQKRNYLLGGLAAVIIGMAIPK